MITFTLIVLMSKVVPQVVHWLVFTQLFLLFSEGQARISIGLFVAISGHQSEQSRDLQLSSFDLLTPQMQPNLLRALPTSIRSFSAIDVVPNQTSDDKIALKLVFTLKFSPFQNDIKGWFSTFISRFPHD